jgi:guanylate kinase
MEIPKHPHQVFIFMGPSGSGKSTIVQSLRKYGIHEHISCTTRAPRRGEVNGAHYYFMSRDDFNRMDLLESNEHSGNLYGIAESEFLRNLNKYPVSVIVTDINGHNQIKQAFPECVTSIFVNAKRSEVAARMKERGDSLDSITKRLAYDDEHDTWNDWVHADYVIDNTGHVTMSDAVEAALHIMNIGPQIESAKAS